MHTEEVHEMQTKPTISMLININIKQGQGGHQKPEKWQAVQNQKRFLNVHICNKFERWNSCGIH